VNLADLGGLFGALVFVLRQNVEALRGLMAAILVLAAVISNRSAILFYRLELRILGHGGKEVLRINFILSSVSEYRGLNLLSLLCVSYRLVLKDFASLRVSCLLAMPIRHLKCLAAN
jgi:hypothetical protein